MEEKVSEELVKKLEVLSRIEFVEDERIEVRKHLNNMANRFDQLKEIDTEKMEAMFHIFPINNVFREDEVKNSNERESMLSNAPDKKDGSFKVPKTID